jgi:tripartite-type tricarboxylate transporter receptor subunit TctC
LMAGAAQLLVANSAVPANNLKELVALARAQPGKVAYGTDGIGSLPHQVYAMLSAGERIETTHVAYRGIAPAFAALLANEVQLSGASVAVAGTLLKAGRIKALAVAGPRRLVQFPNVPTTTEQGFPALKASIWFALFVPAGVAQPVIEKIAADVIAILKQPEFAQRHATDKGLEMFAGGPAQLLAAIREDVASSGMMVKAAGIIPE